MVAETMKGGVYRTYEVYASEYPVHVLDAGGPFLTHSACDGQPLCRQVKAKSLCVDGSADVRDLPPTCPTCLRRDPRFWGKKP